MEHFTVRFLPDQRRVAVPRGTTLIEAADRAGILLYSACGRVGTCGQCRVQVAGQGDVLACQYRVERDVQVTVPDGSRYYTQQILRHTHGEGTAAEPSLIKVFLPGVEVGPDACVDRIGRILGRPVRSCPPAQESSVVDMGVLGSGSGITAVCRESLSAEPAEPLWLIGVEPGDTRTELYGLAVDLGTTTIVGRLHDLQSGHVLATVAEANPQIRYGDDVVSRIHHAGEPAGREALQSVVTGCLDDLLGRACGEAHVSRERVYEVLVAGNTTMGHLLVGLPVASLGQAPYHAHTLEMQDRAAASLGIKAAPGARVVVLPNIAGFVGADTTAVALAVGLDDLDENTLVVDIGTNGELLLKAGGRMLAASCAAGPALEGARIGQGSRAVDGAIQSVEVIDGRVEVDVIGGVAARTICGSGLIDAVAVMLETGVLDASGRFLEDDELPESMSQDIRFRRVVHNGQPAFVIAGGPANVAGRVLLTQRDIREVQLAKGAIRTGAELLLGEAGLKVAELHAVLLAGAFGNYIRRASALRIGLLPPVAEERIHFVGNAALAGASMSLVNRSCRRRAVELARRIKYVEIAHRPDFQMAFAESMLF